MLKERKYTVRGFFFLGLKGKIIPLRDLESDILDRITMVQNSCPE